MEAEWESNEDISGVDFGSQLLQRAYHVEKVPTGSSEASNHLIFYRPFISETTFESFRPLLKLCKSIIRWKYIIFLFNSASLKDKADQLWPLTVSLRNLKKTLLEPLTDCNFKRAKIQKEGMTIYLYMVKLKKDDELMVEDEWKRLIDHVTRNGNIF